jgi:hypothetical protein
LELYLKIILDDPTRARGIAHDLPALVRAIEEKFRGRASEWDMARVREFSEIDPSSDLFRYADRPAGHPKRVEVWVDFHQLKVVMARLSESFERIVRHRPSR